MTAQFPPSNSQTWEQRRVAPARRLLTVACHVEGDITRCGQDLTDQGELWQDAPDDIPDCPACLGREEQETLL
ncbi:hypothetical protein J5X84_36260 [Streptosporangiaceae bacterium NEAU-GS5]|nr:hypothetical protein [Streptosporangiaceae bacterium NEAU-GS5]